MATNRRLRRTRRTPIRLDAKTLRAFATGDGIHGDGAAALRPLWEEHGEELLALWVAACPGERPWAFWNYDHAMAAPVDELRYLKTNGLLGPGEAKAAALVDEEEDTGWRECGWHDGAGRPIYVGLCIAE
jgi:hypothetical protein